MIGNYDTRKVGIGDDMNHVQPSVIADEQTYNLTLGCSAGDVLTRGYVGRGFLNYNGLYLTETDAGNETKATS
ncbi:hypothetical protein Trydic_g19066 [Trypoxylus dichotomus]